MGPPSAAARTLELANSIDGPTVFLKRESAFSVARLAVHHDETHAKCQTASYRCDIG
jgi:hypothetical protein